MSISMKVGVSQSLMTHLLFVFVRVRSLCRRHSQQRNLIPRQDRVDLGMVRRDPAIEPALPLLLSESHAHRDLVVEANLGVGLERDNAPFVGAGMPAREKPGDRTPDDR